MTTLGKEQAVRINANPKSRYYAVPGEGDRFKLVPKGLRFYQAAVQSRLTADWGGSDLSVNDLLKYGQLRTLISRSRELEANNEYWDGFLKLAERNVVGSDGILLRMMVYEPDGKGNWTVDRAAGSAIEDAWRQYCRRKNFLVTQDMCAEDVQRVAIRSIARDGAIICRRIRDGKHPHGVTWQLLEIDHLDPDLNTTVNGNRITMGVESDKFGRVIAYHLLTDHPGESAWTSGGRRYIRVPAEDIIHPFNPVRIGQKRGFPWGASSMYGVRMLGAYREAELVAARQAANQGGFFRDPQGIGNPYGEEGGARGCDPESIMPQEPGLTQYIGSLDFQAYNPNHPVQAYGDFVNEILRGFATGLGVSHHNATGNMNGVTYSSARIAELAERDQWKMVQRWFAESFLQPIFEEWLFMALMKGAITTPGGRPLPAAKYDKFNQPTWKGRRWAWVDPAKETKSQIDALRYRLTSRRQIAADNGLDEEDIYEDIATGAKLMAEKGITAPEDFQQVDNGGNSNGGNSSADDTTEEG